MTCQVNVLIMNRTRSDKTLQVACFELLLLSWESLTTKVCGLKKACSDDVDKQPPLCSPIENIYLINFVSITLLRGFGKVFQYCLLYACRHFSRHCLFKLLPYEASRELITTNKNLSCRYDR